MFCKPRRVLLLYLGLSVALAIGLCGGCSPEHYKSEADEEVYKIIDSKWQEGFGEKVNYIVSDSEIAASANDIQIEDPIPAGGVINLVQAVAMATANNRGYQTQKEELYLKTLTLTGVRHKYTRQWFGTIDSSYEAGGEEDMDVATGFGFNHEQLLADGILISTGIALDWVRFLAGDPRTSLASVLSASITAPILGAGAGKVAIEKLTQAERNVLYEIRSFNRFRKDFVVSIIDNYYGVLRQRDGVTNALNNYKRRMESTERLRAEAEAGRIPPFEADQAEQRQLDAKDSFVRSERAYKELLDVFKIRLALPTDANMSLDQNDLKALEQAGLGEPGYVLDEAIETALLRRLDLANTADRIDDAVRNVLLTADGLEPVLNLFANTAATSDEKVSIRPDGTVVHSGRRTDFEKLKFHEGFYEFGFELDMPFDRKNERNAYRAALIILERQQRQYGLDMDEVKLDVRRAYRGLLEAAEQYRIRKNSLELAESRVESTNMLLQAGRLTTRDLLEAQDALIDAQNNLTSALVAHLIAKLNFFKDVGVLQVQPDGMWE